MFVQPAGDRASDDSRRCLFHTAVHEIVTMGKHRVEPEFAR